MCVSVCFTNDILYFHKFTNNGGGPGFTSSLTRFFHFTNYKPRMYQCIGIHQFKNKFFNFHKFSNNISSFYESQTTVFAQFTSDFLYFHDFTKPNGAGGLFIVFFSENRSKNKLWTVSGTQ